MDFRSPFGALGISPPAHHPLTAGHPLAGLPPHGIGAMPPPLGPPQPGGKPLHHLGMIHYFFLILPKIY